MTSEFSPLAVGLGECQISKDPQTVLVAYGLGSCIGVAAYDPQTHIGGLLHAVLPQAMNGAVVDTPSKYVDTGVKYLVEQLTKTGAEQSRLVVKMVGGANMLTVSDLRAAFNIGDRNIAAAKQAISALRLKVQAQEVGGVLGRTLRLYVQSGRMTIRVLGGVEQEL